MEIFTTMITPYKTDGTVDYDTVLKYVDWYYEQGLDGIFAVCQSSEIFYLTLEERVKINSLVYKRAKELEKKGNRPFTVVSSGHIADDFEEQVRELNAIYESGTDALILITNRLDINNEGDDTFISNAEKLLAKLPKEVKLGFYECPYPYKRLVTPKILDWCKSTGRFAYMKDTCCRTDEIKRRVEQLKGCGFKLLNANCQTLLQSMRDGADGYCGIMCNYHPALYAWLGHNINDKRADFVQSFIGTFGYTEDGLPYPLSAKHHMSLCGIKTEPITRKPGPAALNPDQMSSVAQMKMATDLIENMLFRNGDI